MLQSLFVYSSLLGVMILFSLVTQQRHSYSKTLSSEGENNSFWKIYIIFPLIVFSIIFGMRYDVGTDHLAYISTYSEGIVASKGEPIFDAITYIFQGLGLHYVYYFTFLAFIQVFFFFYAFKNEKYLFPFLVFFLFTNFEWLFWMNGIRQALALCIWLFAIRYIEEKRFWMYLLFCIISSSFHYSASVLIVFYPLLKNGRDYFKSINLQLLILVSAFIIQQFFTILLPKIDVLIGLYKSILGGGKAYTKSYGIERLMKSYIDRGGTNLVYLAKILMNVIIIAHSKKLKEFYNSKRFVIIYFFFFFGLITLYIFPIGYISITRPFRYFYIFDTIIYAYFAYYLLKNRTPQNQLLYLIFIVLFIGVFISAILVATEDSNMLYQFYFDQK